MDETIESFFKEVLKEIITRQSIQTDETGNEYIAEDSFVNKYLSGVFQRVSSNDEDLKELAKEKIMGAIKTKEATKIAIDSVLSDQQLCREIIEDLEVKTLMKKAVVQYFKSAEGKKKVASAIMESIGQWDRYRAEEYIKTIYGK